MIVFQKISTLILIAFMLFSLGCHPSVKKQSKQGIALFGIPANAMVYIDGKYFGIGASVNRHPIALSVGKHKIYISDHYYYPYFSTFKLASGDLLKRRIKLYRKLVE